MKPIIRALLFACALSPTVVLAQSKLNTNSSAVKQVNKAATIFKEIMDTPDKSVPQTIFAKAQCVAVFPQVIKAGFVIGGRGGRGVASCKTANGWSAPAYFTMKGGSFGLQIGAQATDFILLFMNERGMSSLLSSKFEIGGDASAAAGPVGRQAGASTDLKLDAQILSYSRSKGAFAGLELKGTVIALDQDDMYQAYGNSASATAILKGEQAIPAMLNGFSDMLQKYSTAGKPGK